MERSNNLSDNLKVYQNARRKSLAEFSEELGIARSTMQSILVDGNTTVDTLIRMANTLYVSLDELVFGNLPSKRLDSVQCFLRDMEWFSSLPPEKQEKFRSLLCELLTLLEYDS